MKVIKKTNRPTVRAVALALTLAALPTFVAKAVPYASCITNNGTTVSYYLNEAATNVTVIYDGGGVGKTNNLGTLSQGQHNFSYTGHTSYKIVVTQNAPVGWSQISADTNPACMYGSPRGVTVSQVATNLSTFGRIYVSDSASPGTTALRLQDAVTKQWRTNDSKGIFVLNADRSDAVGQMSICGTNVCFHAFTNGIELNFTTPSTASPYRLGFGQDNRLYGSSFGTIDATTWRSLDADGKNYELVLAVPGENNNPTVHTDSISKPIAHGSTEDGSLVLWNLDGAYAGHFNSIAQWDILSGPLPWNNPPTFVGTASAYSTVVDVGCDLDLGPDGKWFILVNRSAGTDRSSIQIYDTDGTTLLWDSFTQYGITPGNTANPDPLRNAQSCALSPDGKTFSFVRTDNSIMMFALTNGIIDQSTLFTYTAPASGSVTAPATGNARQMCYDAAGNIYTVSSGQARLRVYAPGGFTVATTSSDGTFTLVKPSTTVSVAATVPTTSMDTTQPPGVFTLTRAGDTASPLAVGYTLTGTATNGVHYTLLSGTANFLGGDVTKDVNVVAIPFTPAGPTRSVTLTINSSNSYSPTAPLTATIYIIDTNKPVLNITRKDAQMYERTNDLARFTISRLGDTNVDLSNVIITYGGTAANGTDFIGTSPAAVPLGASSQDFSISPIHNGVVTGPLTVTATIAPAVDNTYNVGATNVSAAVTIVDSDDPPETVLWADYFTNDTHLNWTVLFATTNSGPDNYRVNDYANDWTQGWPYDYANNLGIPLAPHAVNGNGAGIRLTVNKDQPAASSAASALNLYPTGKSFSGNYALRFDMFLIQNSSSGTTEYALFGVNHSGTKTNWFRNSATAFTGVDPATWSFDGIFYDVESDGAALGDYVGYSAPMTASHNPTAITAGRNASTLTGVFKSPPWTPGAGTGGAAANRYGTVTPIWADVEVKQINNVISWSINHTLIFAYTNTTPYTSGNVMIGYCDAYDSLGADGGSVVYANVRVISLQSPNILTIQRNGANAEVTFSANAGDTTGQFVLQSASVVTGPYTDTSSTMSTVSPGVFKAVKAAAPTQQYYRVRRVY